MDKKALLDELKIDRSEDASSHDASVKWIITLLLLAGAGYGGWSMFFQPPVQALEVRTILAQSPNNAEDSNSVLDATGYVIARRMATVSSKITGKVMEVLVEEGMAVEEGQLLAVLDDSINRAQLALSESQVTAARAEFQGLDLGSTIRLRQTDWTIVGIFESGGSSYESEVWADMIAGQSAFQRLGAVNTIRVKVSDVDKIPAMEEEFLDDPRLNLTLVGEEEYFSEQSEGLITIVNTSGYSMGIIMAFGAVFTALNTMYAAVSNRTVEIATLRALGFGATPVVVSIMIEAIVLAAIGGMLGAAIAYIGFNGYTVSTLNQSSFSQMAFDFAVTPALIRNGMMWVLTLGFIGGLFPALRAARLPITLALRGE